MMSAVYRGWRIAEDLKANYGIEDYIEKPFRIAEMLAKVTRAPRATQPEPHRRAIPRRSTAAPRSTSRTASTPTRRARSTTRSRSCSKGIAIDPLAYRLRFHLGADLRKAGADLRRHPGARERGRPQSQALPGAEEPRRPLRKGRLPQQGGRDVGEVRPRRAGRRDARVDQGAPAEACVTRVTRRTWLGAAKTSGSRARLKTG